MIMKVNIYLTPEWMEARSPTDDIEHERMHDLEVEAVLKICDAVPEGVTVEVRDPQGDLLYTPNEDV